jgi:hypothetical protein
MTYAEKLKDPRWQKKRLVILERAGWACQVCGDKETTLHVHHLKYGKEPWEIEDKYLECLCESCHEVRGYNNKILATLIRLAPSKYIKELESYLIHKRCELPDGDGEFLNAELAAAITRDFANHPALIELRKQNQRKTHVLD